MSEGFGIYVHWPYCAAKCPYCDFNSHVRERFDDARWASAITKELHHVAELQKNFFLSPLEGESVREADERGITAPPPPSGPLGHLPPQAGKERSVTSIFFGGGTPSLMRGRAVASVLDKIAGIWTVAPDAEITLEANPNSVEQERFRDYRAAGVNRVSIGVQALDDAALKFLGRLHGVEEAKTAIKLARDIFPRASFDLIYARPQQSREEWVRELKEALAFGTEHLSVYQLTIEPGTSYATLARQGKLTVPDEDRAATLFETTQEICEAAGLHAYEVSNHAREGAQSRHNLTYWRYGDYAGVGPGAHGRLTIGGKRLATEAERLPERWFAEIERKGHSFTLTDIASEAASREHLLMGLRLSEGIDLERYRARWGTAPESSRITALTEAGLVTMNGNNLTATPRGRLVLNSVIKELAE
jgi:putative oxygen-independent coproporphyrinogen III oxidase